MSLRDKLCIYAGAATAMEEAAHSSHVFRLATVPRSPGRSGDRGEGGL